MTLTDKKNIQTNELIIQHNNLIEAKYSISLQEKRLILLMSSRIQKNDKKLEVYSFSIQEICEIFQINNKNIYKEIDNVISKLFTRVLTVRNLIENSVTKISWLTYAKYWYGQGIIQLSFNEKLKPYLLEIQEKFTKINIGEIIGLKSIYAIRIFELLKQYEVIGRRTFELNELREYCGISKNKYLLYTNLKSKVLEIAKREINTRTDYSTNYIEIKESRKIVKIEWTIEKKKSKTKTRIEKVKIELETFQKELRSKQLVIDNLIEYGFSKIIAKRLITEHNEEIVKNAIRAVDLQVERGKAKNPKAMIKTAIEEKWHPEIFKTKK